jgi:hypothetical protein
MSEARIAIDGRRGEILGDVGNEARVAVDNRRGEIVGSHFDGDGGETESGAYLHGSHTASTDLPFLRKGRGYAFVGDGFVGGDGRGARRLRRAILADARAGREVPATAVDAYVGAINRRHLRKTGRPMTVVQTERAKGALLAEVADLGGRVRGAVVSGMGDWLQKVWSVPGAVVAKGGELATRMTAGVAKAAFTVPYGAVKSTFFKKGGKKGGGGMSQAVTDASDEGVVERAAGRAARQRRRRRELEARLSAAESRRQLMEMEEKEEAEQGELEARAAAAEAEAREMESSSGSDATDQRALARRAALLGEAVEARVAKSVLRNAGPFAKAAISRTPFGGFFRFAEQVYKEAKVDPEAAAKVAKLKQAAEAGSADAAKTLNTLAMGQRVAEEKTAADLVNRELAQRAQAAAASSTGATWIAGLLPSSEATIAAIPGASALFSLARAGNERALASVRAAAEVLRACEAGDQGACLKVKTIGKMAASGDRAARVLEAVYAVAAAGIREERHAASVRGEARAPAGPAAPAVRRIVPAALSQETAAHRWGAIGTLARDVFGGRGYAEGLAVKLAQR